jgi:hypothetical protein
MKSNQEIFDTLAQPRYDKLQQTDLKHYDDEKGGPGRLQYFKRSFPLCPKVGQSLALNQASLAWT